MGSQKTPGKPRHGWRHVGPCPPPSFAAHVPIPLGRSPGLPVTPRRCGAPAPSQCTHVSSRSDTAAPPRWLEAALAQEQHLSTKPKADTGPFLPPCTTSDPKEECSFRLRKTSFRTKTAQRWAERCSQGFAVQPHSTVMASWGAEGWGGDIVGTPWLHAGLGVTQNGVAQAPHRAQPAPSLPLPLGVCRGPGCPGSPVLPERRCRLPA